jgi:uncharacterized protein YndB with AHSA1/START domain
MSDSASATDSAVHEFTITRVIDASRERVFDAWTDPRRLARWFAPRGWTAPLSQIALDLRPGGTWRVTMVDEAGAGYPAVFHYRDVTAPERLAFTTGAPDQDPDDSDIPVASVTFQDVGGKTEMTFSGSARGAEAGEVQQGWSMMFDRLADEVAGA